MQEPTDDQMDRVLLSVDAIPAVLKASDDEVKRRREIIARMLRRREEVGPIGIRADDLLYQARIDADR